MFSSARRVRRARRRREALPDSFTWASSGAPKPPATGESNPLARGDNGTFPPAARTKDISHGELIRTGNTQAMTVDGCRLQLRYQGTC